MTKSPEFNESRLNEAVAIARSQKKLNIARITRENNVSYTTLRDRVKKPKIPAIPITSKKNLLEPYQEKALIN
jgi:hypothetical protein